MLKRTLLLLTLGVAAVSVSQAQKIPTATRSLDIQVGGDYIYGHSDYGTKLHGYGIYSTIDFKPHFGAVLEFNQANGTDQIYERTYEVGARYVRHYGKLNPYAKFMVGRGVFNFPPPSFDPTGPPSANLAYNMLAFGGGVDYKLRRSINIRGDYEYQTWESNGGLVHGLTPWLASVGAAYHFH